MICILFLPPEYEPTDFADVDFWSRVLCPQVFQQIFLFGTSPPALPTAIGVLAGVGLLVVFMLERAAKTSVAKTTLENWRAAVTPNLGLLLLSQGEKIRALLFKLSFLCLPCRRKFTPLVVIIEVRVSVLKMLGFGRSRHRRREGAERKPL